MKYPEVKGKVVDFIQASAQTEGAFVNIRFTDKTDLGLTFNAKMKLDSRQPQRRERRQFRTHQGIH